ncbi:hypothetical protein [Haemophilus haemolyticus]|uniref:hypothetical protein n=1 Tax=Haemophilus haemolyticus TaxID=726 RepID=UPI000E596C85|nr:hypothetical protein [Haemophilus haemolyticus]
MTKYQDSSNNVTFGSDSPIMKDIKGDVIYKPGGDVIVNPPQEKTVKAFIECSDEELREYAFELAERFKKERSEKKKLVKERSIKLFLIPVAILIIATIYVVIKSQDKHILDIAVFLVAVLSIVIGYAAFLGISTPNKIEKQYLATAQNIIDELDFRQNKSYSEEIRKKFK